MKKLCLALSLLVFSSLSYADSFSGKWFMKANGFAFVLDIAQTGSNISGTMKNVSNDRPESTIDGIIEGRKITFTRYNSILVVPQEYEGYLYELAPNTNEMAGVFSHKNITNYGWHAERQ